MSESEVNPFRQLAGEGVLKEAQRWLEFEFNCVRGKAEEALETLHKLGYRRYLLDGPIRGVSARWQEIINGHTGEVVWTGTYINGTCLEDQQQLIVEAIFDIGAVKPGNDYYLNRIHFWDSRNKIPIEDSTTEGFGPNPKRPNLPENRNLNKKLY